MRRRTIKRRLFWTGVVLALLLLALAGIVVRGVGAFAPTARRAVVQAAGA